VLNILNKMYCNIKYTKYSNLLAAPSTLYCVVLLSESLTVSKAPWNASTISLMVPADLIILI
jgi:hypothetical protein